MENKNLLFLFILFCFSFIFKFNLQALECQYKSSDEYKASNSERFRNVVFNISINENFEFNYKINMESKSTSQTEFVDRKFESYDYFLPDFYLEQFIVGEGDERKFKCIEKLYFSVDIDFGQGTFTYNVSEGGSGLSLKLNSSDGEGELIVEKMDQNEWKNICKYRGAGTLYIGADKYELGGYEAYDFTIGDLIENGYKCPNYLCVDNVYGVEVKISEKDFSGMAYKCYESHSVLDGCVIYKNYYDSYEENFKNYRLCKQNNEKDINSCIIYLNEYKKIAIDLRKYCKSALSEKPYRDECVKSCLNLNDDISFDDDKNLVCGFTDRLLAIINNVLRWIKYILPAIVIIFGIIDFLKAIGSDKEDEMKKAQHKFIIRLISAALVFIVPFIIVFILDKMGFTPDSCGIDLFK